MTEEEITLTQKRINAMTDLTREQIENWKTFFQGRRREKWEESITLCDMALAYLDLKAAEPTDAGYREAMYSLEVLREHCGNLSGGYVLFVENYIKKLYAAFAARGDAGREGWQLVPKKPTDDMINTASRVQTWSGKSFGGTLTTVNVGCDAAKAIYTALLAAAPKPEKE
jgi:hypothetical protein